MDNPNTSHNKKIIKGYSLITTLTQAAAILMLGLPICIIILCFIIFSQNSDIYNPVIPNSLISLVVEICNIVFIIGIFIVPPLFIIFLIQRIRFTRLIKNNPIDTLSPFVNDTESDVREIALKYIAKTHDERAIHYLENAITDKDAGVRKLALSSLANTQKEKAIPYLENALNDTDPEIRKLALSSLTNNQYEKSIPYLEKALNDTDPEIRKLALNSLANTHDKRAIPHLENALNDKDEAVRTTAKVCLNSLKKDIKKGKMK